MRSYLSALRMLLAFTVVLGVAYPLAVTAVAQLPGLKSRADGSIVKLNGQPVGSALLAQPFTDRYGRPLRQYFQERPSTGDYDPTATGASNLGPESIVGPHSLLAQVCARSYAIGRLEHVDGRRPFCTATGGAAALAVFPGTAVSVNQPCPAIPFVTTYRGRPVTCAPGGADYRAARIVPIRGDAPAHPAVPADAVTASGSSLDPEISLAYARLQEPRVARARGIAVRSVAALVGRIATGRDLGFLGEAKVNVLRLNIALDETYPVPA